MIVERENPTIKYLIQNKNQKIIEVNKKKFDSKNNIEGVIRIHEKDYPFIPSDTPYFTHFNLQNSRNIINEIYALPKIIKPGYFNKNGKEVLPILSFENCYIGKCISIDEEINYNKITLDHFKYSLTNIQSVKELKKEIIFRYSISMPDLTEKEIITLGVAITNIKIISKLSLD